MKIEEESVVTSRGRCPSCATKGHDRAGDNLANYDDGHSYCFSCGYYSSEKGKKVNRICGWRKLGIICDYEAIYDIYINTHKCDFCLKDFKNSKDRNLDHNHLTGEIRGILCMNCNVKDVLKGN